MRVGLVISARTGSTRLPGKTLLKLGSHSVIGLMLERLKRSRYGQNMILATTMRKADDALVSAAKKYGVSVFRGSEEDVLGRMCGACAAFKFNIFVRLTGDCPLVDPEVVDLCVDRYLENDYDMVTTKYRFPMGIDCEVLSYHLLERISTLTHLGEDREHVTLYLWKNRDRYKIHSVDAPPEMDYPEYILTLDEKKDYERIKEIVEYFGEDAASCKGGEIIHFLQTHPHLIEKRDLKNNKRLWKSKNYSPLKS